jgi:hypothetical protein
MALIDSYRNAKIAKQKELSRLTSDKAKEFVKLSDLNKKINSTSDAMKRTKSVSTVNSKSRDLERYNKDIANTNRKIADFESKIVRKEKEILDYQTRINKEQISIDKKIKVESDKSIKAQELSLRNINTTLNYHDRLHESTIHEIKELKNIPKKITVLFLASNPIDQIQLRLDEEARSISEMIRKAKHRDSVKLESCWALQPMDLLQALNDYNPTIVHFSGHGSDEDEIVFQAPDGTAKLVSKEAIVQTMMASSENIRLVFFNTCYSRIQAEAVSQYADATIGMNTSIRDEAARIFSSQFYSSIGFGHSVGKAFQQAKALLMMEGTNEENTPQLFIKDGLNANDIILVQP